MLDQLFTADRPVATPNGPMEIIEIDAAELVEVAGGIGTVTIAGPSI